MALGIHVDTGSLTFDHSTARDAMALAWLMTQGVNLRAVGEYVEPGLSPELQDLLSTALEQIQTETLRGYTIGWVLLVTDNYVPGLSSLASLLIDLTEVDALLLGNSYSYGETPGERLVVIGRSRIEGTDLNYLFKPWGGGGHIRAASVTLRDVIPEQIITQLFAQLREQIPHPPTAKDLMSSPVRTIRPETTVGEATRILLRYGHSGLSVVNTADQLVGIISRRDLDIALHHGFSHAPVKGYMTSQLMTINPDTTLPEIEEIMVNYDIGRLPVLQQDNLVGIVTRTDVLRELHHHQFRQTEEGLNNKYCPLPINSLKNRLLPPYVELLTLAAKQAEKRGWQLYLVGGAVRDLLLADPEKPLILSDIDLVVDGCHNWQLTLDKNSSEIGNLPKSPAVEIAQKIQREYENCRLEIHGQFQTAALLWHKDSIFDSLWIDIATARTEFYPYPAANPEVEASSIRQDLYRRDFTINALALRLTPPREGEMLDFFGGLFDLQKREIKVLHPNSFIEDPTRIYRAVRFAVKLKFNLETQTEAYIHHAINSGIYHQAPIPNRRTPALETRLRTELKYILESHYWQPALKLLGKLHALRCLHPSLELDQELWKKIKMCDRYLQKLANLRDDPGFPQGIIWEEWLVRLEILIANIVPEYREKVAQNLQLPLDSCQRLKQLELAHDHTREHLPKCDQPSEIVLLLRKYDWLTLLLIGLQTPRVIRRKIWQYLTKFAHITPILDGNDLKDLGYKPGPKFKQMLDDLLIATLDGVIKDQKEAIKFVLDRYPNMIG